MGHRSGVVHAGKGDSAKGQDASTAPVREGQIQAAEWRDGDSRYMGRDGESGAGRRRAGEGRIKLIVQREIEAIALVPWRALVPRRPEPRGRMGRPRRKNP